MRYLIAILILVVTLATMVQASDLNLSYKTMYVGGDSGSIFYDGPVIQADHTWTVGKTSYAGLWGSIGLAGNKDGANYGNEVDAFAGTQIGKADIGLNYYNMGKLDRLGDDCLALYVNIPLGKFGEWNAKVHAEYDWATDPDALDGNMYHFSADRKIGTDTLRINTGGHFKSFGTPAETISFYGLEYIKPIGKDINLSIRGQLSTHKWGRASDVLLVGLSTKVSL